MCLIILRHYHWRVKAISRRNCCACELEYQMIMFQKEKKEKIQSQKNMQRSPGRKAPSYAKDLQTRWSFYDGVLSIFAKSFLTDVSQGRKYALTYPSYIEFKCKAYLKPIFGFVFEAVRCVFNVFLGFDWISRILYIATSKHRWKCLLAKNINLI